MDIRPALASEAPALTGLAARLFRETYAGQVPEADVESYVATAFRPEVQAKEITVPGGGVMAAWEGRELLAYAQLRPSPSPCPLDFSKPLEVARFYVDSRQHGTGLAGSLMKTCLAWAATRGHAGLWLQVWEANPRAIRFYEKHGFQDCGETSFLMGTMLYRDRVLARPFLPVQRPRS
jgi:GNAT superfamily N-acetyltransferase